jgi:hypothetical protein
MGAAGLKINVFNQKLMHISKRDSFQTTYTLNHDNKTNHGRIYI